MEIIGCLQDLCQLYMEGQLEMLKVSFSFITNFLKLTLNEENVKYFTVKLLNLLA